MREIKIEIIETIDGFTWEVKGFRFKLSPLVDKPYKTKQSAKRAAIKAAKNRELI